MIEGKKTFVIVGGSLFAARAAGISLLRNTYSIGLRSIDHPGIADYVDKHK